MSSLKIFALIIVLFIILPSIVLARVTPNDLYQEKRATFQTNLSKITDSNARQKIITVDQKLNEVNQKVCDKYDLDIQKLSAILEEEKARQNVTKTVVAYGQGNTQLDTAAYYLNYAAEALAYQRSQDYTPQIGNNNPKAALNNSLNNLKSDLRITQGKILRAQSEIKKVLDLYEK